LCTYYELCGFAWFFLGWLDTARIGFAESRFLSRCVVSSWTQKLGKYLAYWQIYCSSSSWNFPQYTCHAVWIWCSFV